MNFSTLFFKCVEKNKNSWYVYGRIGFDGGDVLEITIDQATKEAIEDIVGRRKTAIVYCSRKGLVVAEQSTKIKSINPDAALRTEQ